MPAIEAEGQLAIRELQSAEAAQWARDKLRHIDAAPCPAAVADSLAGLDAPEGMKQAILARSSANATLLEMCDRVQLQFARQVEADPDRYLTEYLTDPDSWTSWLRRNSLLVATAAAVGSAEGEAASAFRLFDRSEWLAPRPQHCASRQLCPARATLAGELSATVSLLFGEHRVDRRRNSDFDSPTEVALPPVPPLPAAPFVFSSPSPDKPASFSFGDSPSPDAGAPFVFGAAPASLSDEAMCDVGGDELEVCSDVVMQEGGGAGTWGFYAYDFPCGAQQEGGGSQPSPMQEGGGGGGGGSRGPGSAARGRRRRKRRPAQRRREPDAEERARARSESRGYVGLDSELVRVLVVLCGMLWWLLWIS